VRRDLSDAHGMHRRVLTAFADQELESSARREFGALYRVDETPRGDISVLVQSSTAPDWTRLPERYLLTTFEPNPAITELSALERALETKRAFRFRLRANATKRLKANGEPKRGKRIELVGPEALLLWLRRKAAPSGFEIAKREQQGDPNAVETYRLQITEEPKVRGRRRGAQLTFGSSLFEGELVITDPPAFSATLRMGLGSAKAYGFGLLSLAPA